jgi:DNA-directed RNA polymerase specialized sigma24 family protein
MHLQAGRGSRLFLANPEPTAYNRGHRRTALGVPMPSTGSVTYWINRLKAGDRAAAQKLWERYIRQLERLARQKLHGMPRRPGDEEDVAVSAFASFCRGAERGRFPQLYDRDNLWKILVALATRKARDLVRGEQRQKRGGGLLLDEAALLRQSRSLRVERTLEEIISREPTPEFAAQLAEECQRLLTRLDDAELRSIALWKMEGYTNDEIAARLDRAPRTVERRLRLIRSIWAREATP